MSDLFTSAANFADLAEIFQAKATGSWESPGVIQPHALAPGLIANRHRQRELHPMRYGFAAPQLESAAGDARVFTHVGIEAPEKWPWLAAIETTRCVLPVASFNKHAYWGDPEGTEIELFPVEGGLLHAAGVYQFWESPVAGAQICTMSFLTRPAGDYVMDHGSDRQPIFLASAGIDAWIDSEPLSSDAATSLLRRISVDPELAHRHLRDLPVGWDQKQKGKIRKRGQTMAWQDRCEHACGF